MTDDTSPPPTKPVVPRAQLPLKLHGGKTAVRGQFAALCWRRDAVGAVEVCLVTGRRSGRWILPKGWPMHNQTPAAAAATEAWEEAGLRGVSQDRCLGVYADVKPLSRRTTPVVVLVYPLHVHEVAEVWPEARARKRRWFAQGLAAARLGNPVLRRILEQFDPDAP